MLKTLLLLAYGVLSVVEFLVTWAKDKISEELKGKPPEPPDQD